MSDPADSRSDNSRRFRRADMVMEVQYRSTGSFLVSYSLNLSKGGLFLHTDDLLPIGTKLTVTFTVPGAGHTVEAEARVIWRREEGARGLGLQFDGLEQTIGEQIDSMISGFAGVRLMAVAGDTPTLDRLSHYLRSVIACEVLQQTAREVSEVGFLEQPDLLLLDLDSAGDEGMRTIAAGLAWEPPVPVVVLSREESLRQKAEDAGGAAAFDNPPPFKQLRQRVLEVLARPAAQPRVADG